MKDRIAHLLVRLAERLCPTFELKPTYEAKEIAIAVAITKKNIRQYRSSRGGKCSYRKGVVETERYRRVTITVTSSRQLNETALLLIRSM